MLGSSSEELREWGEGLGTERRGQRNAGNNPQENGKDRPDLAVVLALAGNYNLLSISRLHWSRLRGEGQQQSTSHIFQPVVLKGGSKTPSNV